MVRNRNRSPHRDCKCHHNNRRLYRNPNNKCNRNNLLKFRKYSKLNRKYRSRRCFRNRKDRNLCKRNNNQWFNLKFRSKDHLEYRKVQ